MPTKSATPPFNATLAIAVLLAFAGGFTDTVGFVALFKLFTAHVTGNFVVLGAALIDPQHGLIAKLLALPVFVLTIAVARSAHHRLTARGVGTEKPLLMAQTLLLLGFMIVGLLASPIRDPDEPLAILAGLSGVAAMAIQNAASKTIFGKLAPTTVMTGNVTQIVIDAVDLLGGVPDESKAAIAGRLWKMIPPVLGFAAGALLGGLAFIQFGFLSLSVSIAAIAGVMFLYPLQEK